MSYPLDDIVDNRAVLRELLQTVGFEVGEANNGAEALAIFENWLPQAVLMDMRMPVMDGYEATRRIKSMAVGRQTPIIAVTASAFEGDKENILAIGMDAYIRKPFQSEEIFTILGKCLNLRYIFSDEIKLAPAHPSSLLSVPADIALPQETMLAMRQAVSDGDIAYLMALIDQIEKIDCPLAGALRALADQYDYKNIEQWLTEKGNDHDS